MALGNDSKPSPLSRCSASVRAEHLIGKSWIEPKRLAFHSGSAGGIIAGNLVANFPDLFAAVISDVGVLNVSRHQRRAAGSANIAEYGDINNSEDAVVMQKSMPISA